MLLLILYQTKEYFYNNMLISALFFSMLSVALSIFFYGRPQIFSFFLLFFELKCLYNFYENPKSKTIYFLPLIACLWSNFHGGSSNLSYILCLPFIFSGVSDYSLGRITFEKYEKKTMIKLLTVTVLTAAAILINPIGLQVFTYPYINLGDGLMQSVISEWSAPDAKEIGQLIIYFFPIFLMSIGFISNRNKVRAADILIMCFFLLLFFRSVRFIMLWYIAAAFYAFRYMPKVKLKDIKSNFEKAVMIIFSIILLALFGISVEKVYDICVDGDLISKVLSDEMILAIKEDNPKRMFNDYNFGESLIYNDMNVFFDGRADIWSSCGVLADGISLIFLSDCSDTDNYYTWVDVNDLLEKYNFDSILIYKQRPLYSYILGNSDKFECVFEDESSAYFRILPEKG